MVAAACGGTGSPADVEETSNSALPLVDGAVESDDTPDSDQGDSDQADQEDQVEQTDQQLEQAASTETSDADPTPPDGSRTTGCSATSATDGIDVAWWGMPAPAEGDDLDDPELDSTGLDILGDGQVLLQTGTRPDGVVTLFGAPAEPGLAVTIKVRTTDDATTFVCGTAGTLLNLPVPNCTITLVGGKPQLVVSYDDGSAGPLGRTVIRDGEPLSTSPSGGPNPIDTSAEPGVTYEYKIEMSDNSDRAPVIGECGSITVPELGDQSAELLAAKDLFNRTALGPHAYVTVSVEDETQDLYLQALGPDGHAFVPPLDAPEYRNPFTIHDELVAAIDAGQDVSYEIDESSGLPTLWTVDGVTTEFVCFEVDTAPPELRVGPCDPQTDFIGR